MRYLDSGRREVEQAVGYWMRGLRDVSELRIQSGFFAANAIELLAATIEKLREDDLTTRVLIGSNEGATMASDVLRLLEMVGSPRANSKIGVISFAGSFYHPKVIHVRRIDGSEAAYVGSANTTGSGVTALHIEAGVVLDTQDGDPVAILSDIAGAVDAWFTEQRPGLTEVRGPDDVEQLVADGVLVLVRPPRPPAAAPNAAAGQQRTPRPRLRPLIQMPVMPTLDVDPAREIAAEVDANPPAAIDPLHGVGGGIPNSAPRQGYPPYILFAPGVQTPTVGRDAITGSQMVGGAVGLIVKLSLDSSRHFRNAVGTANLSIPVATAQTIRFGIMRGKYARARAEFALYTRLLSDAGEIRGPTLNTNIMAYGVDDDESGHQDLRMLLPAGVKQLTTLGEAQGWALPASGSYVFLAWPTLAHPAFKASFLSPGSQFHNGAHDAFVAAQRAGALMGRGACLLSADMQPAW